MPDQPEDGIVDALLSLSSAASNLPLGAVDRIVVVDRISEQIQPDATTMRLLTDAGVRPGRRVHVTSTVDGVEVWSDGPRSNIDRYVSDHVFVRLG